MRALRVTLFALVALLVVAHGSPAAARSFRVDSFSEDSDAKHGDGVCATASGTCTIRAALEEAEALGEPVEILRPVLGRPGTLRALRGPNGRPITGGPRAPIVTFTVDTTDDVVDAAPGDGACATVTGTCSLRAAVQEANALEGVQAITLPAGDFVLSIEATPDDSAEEGDLDIVDELVVTGAGSALTTLDAGGVDRVFDNFHLLTLTGAHLVGGDPAAIGTDFGDLVLTDGLFTDNVVGISGGSAKLSIADSYFEKNDIAAEVTTCSNFSMTDTTVEGNGNGFGFDRVTGTLEDVVFRENSGDAVAVFIQSRLTLKRVTMDANGRGLAHLGSDFSNFVTLDESTITRSTDRGASYADGLLTILNSRITDNGGCGVVILGNDGGSLTVRNSIVQRNACGVVSNGGRGGVTTMIETTQITDNTGIGLEAIGSPRDRPVTVRGTQIARNHQGGMVVVAVNGNGPDVTVSDSTIADNEAERGAGLLMTSIGENAAPVRVVNSTISRNFATDAGDAIYNDGGSLDLRNVTVTGDVVTLDDSSTTARNSILAGGCVGALTSGAYNVIDGNVASCAISGDATGNVFGPPRLGPLATNGGPTTTHALLAGSPAWNGGNPAGCVDGDDVVLTVDQRGAARPQAGRCDVGAFESACGNGTIEGGETCDDGNNGDGDCCSGTCKLESEGAACNDGDTCSTGDRCVAGTCTPTGEQQCGPCLSCDPAGGCVAEPWTGCHQPTEDLSGELEIVAKPARKIEWSWVEGEATTREELGNPLAAEQYAFCIYGDATGTPELLFRAATRVDPCGKKSCWKPTGKTGFQYTAPTSDALRKVILKSGADGKAKVRVTAKADDLAIPALPIALPIRAQVQAENGQCWESAFFPLGVKKNDAKLFRGKAFLR